MDEGVVIKVDHVGKVFKLPHEKQNSVKSLLLNFYKRNKGFEKQRALNDVTFTVNEGDFFGIVGRNGSGKSTLLKILAGIYNPTQGTVEVVGRLTPFIELGVGFSPELTGRENVFLNGALLGFSRKEMHAMYDDIVAFAELERFMDQKLKNYSSGMQVRLAFSIAIRAQGDILLLDEVLAVGDSAFQQKCYDYFEELKEQKKTVVFVTHDMGAVRRFCNRAIYIQNGNLTLEGSQFDIAETYIEENMNSTQQLTKDDKPNTSNKHQIRAKISDQTENKLKLTVTYESKDQEAMYVGISVLKDGVSVAEICTSLDRPLIGSGELTYSLDTTLFNEGVYFIDAALFKLQNRELLNFVHNNKAQFIVKGHDISRGAALKLSDTWEYK